MMTPLRLLAAASLTTALAAGAETVADCEKHAHYGRTAAARACYLALTKAANPAIRAEGFWHTGDKNQANEAFKLAVKQHPESPAVKVRMGYLYLEYDQGTDAAELFKEALALDEKYAPGLLGLARVAAAHFDRKAIEMAEAALKADPKLVAAQELIAYLALEDNNPKKAIEEADKALAMNAEAFDAMAVRAAVDGLADRPVEAWLDKIFKVNPVYGDAWSTLGHFYVINRRYTEAIAAYRKALELNPNLNSARAELGLNLMRQGLDGEAYKMLETCWSNGYQGDSVKNSLMLMDSYKGFATFETPVSTLKIKKKEAAVLRPYVQAEIDQAIATYEKKYRMKLPGPVQVELYDNHADFEVRTTGMTGLGALGVTFGLSVAMDSPSGRKPGEFHWASTLWHEMSHVYLLTATKHRVPRWFTEGVAVFEETATHPDWGDRLDPQAIKAIKEKKLLPIAELDRGFFRPSYPAQVVVSYFQGGQTCTYIVERWGWDKILAMIQDFSIQTSTADVIEKELGLKPEAFDKDFLAWLDKRTKIQVDNFDSWKDQMKGLAGNAAAKKWDDVIATGPKIRGLYPDYLEGDNAYEFLAEAYMARGDKLSAARELEAYSKEGGKNPATLKRLADLQIELNRKQDAANTLERLNFVYPLDDELHTKLGALYMELGQTPPAVREFEVLVALKPNDMAGARYQLALAYRKAGRLEDAKDQVLQSLEAAPGFRPAQKLLLELTRGPRTSSDAAALPAKKQ